MISKSDLKRIAHCLKAQRSFWHYCKVKAPTFYKDDCEFLEQFCHELQEFADSKEEVLMINLPPRHGKSRTATLFVQWLLGHDNKLKIMTASYNQTLSATFAEQVRDTIKETKADEDKIIYNDIFPLTRISPKSGAKEMWKLVGSEQFNYLATSPSGTATGFGADYVIVDDLIKNEYEARNENNLNKQYEWFTNTLLSRLEGKRKVILIMTRWSSKDLCGRLQAHFDAIGTPYRNIIYKANNKGVMLCDDILNLKAYNSLKATLGEDIMSANYNQIPIDLKGRLYTHFTTYEQLPTDIIKISAYTDTADKGSDYLASVVYATSRSKMLYILDIIYTKEPMEVTEPLIAQQFMKYNVGYAYIESNNGGRGFGRAVKRIMREKGHRSTVIVEKTQTANKESRIFTGATGVMNSLSFQHNWNILYPEAYRSMCEFQREGKNEHDDIQDCLTGVYETGVKSIVKVKF